VLNPSHDRQTQIAEGAAREPECGDEWRFGERMRKLIAKKPSEAIEPDA
jgi:hypothetical protein